MYFDCLDYKQADTYMIHKFETYFWVLGKIQEWSNIWSSIITGVKVTIPMPTPPIHSANNYAMAPTPKDNMKDMILKGEIDVYI